MEILANLAIILFSVITVMCIVHSKFVMSKVPQSVPWAGRRIERLSKTRACIREFTAGLRTLRIGYNQVCESFLLTLALLIVSVCSSVERVYLV